MFLLATLVATIMTLAALLHFYWAFGGNYGLNSAGPKFKGSVEFNPGRVLTFFVACLIVGLAMLAIQLEHPWLPVNDFASYVGYCVSVLFIIRAIGDFRYIGFFKKIYNSNFSRLDSRYFSPLFLFLGLAYAVLSRW